MTYHIKIRARDAAGNTSAWTNEIFTVTPPEVPAGQSRSAPVDVNGDGLVDEVLPSGINAVVNYDFSFWDFDFGYYSPWNPFDYWHNYNAFTSGGGYYGGFQSVWDWNFNIYTPAQTSLDVTATFDPEPHYIYGIYEDTSGSSTIAPGNLSLIVGGIDGGSGATQYIGLGTYLDYELSYRRFYTVRYGFAPSVISVVGGIGGPISAVITKTPLGGGSVASVLATAAGNLPIDITLSGKLILRPLDIIGQALGGRGRQTIWTVLNAFGDS